MTAPLDGALDEFAALLAAAARVAEAAAAAPDVQMVTGRIRTAHPAGQLGGQVDVVLDEDGQLKECTSWTSNFDAAVAALGRPALAGKTVVLLVIGGRYYPDCVITGGG